MRKIILMMSVSLDGFFETADRDISWHRVDDELLQAQPGGDIALSGAEVPATFRNHALIDEFRIRVHPVVLGGSQVIDPPAAAAVRPAAP